MNESTTSQLTAEEREKLYDDQIAPLLRQAMDICHANGLNMLSVVEWSEKGDENAPSYGRSFVQSRPISELLFGLNELAKRGYLSQQITSMVVKSAQERVEEISVKRV